MGGHKTISGSSYPTPAAPVPPLADYNVTGTLTPDATCNYFLAGTYNGKPYYRRADGAYFIWWNVLNDTWFISSILGEYNPPYWFHDTELIVGIYEPGDETFGIATVSLGPH